MSSVLPATTTLLLVLSALFTATVAVVDTDGDDIRNNGGAYYIKPYEIGFGGQGLTLAPNPTAPCPHYITRSDDETFAGIPVRFSSPFKIGIIPDNFSVAITFITDIIDVCIQPWAWQVIQGENGLSYIATGGAEKEGFTIENVDEEKHVYKIKHCSSDGSGIVSGYVGLLKDRLLGITNNGGLRVQFRKAFDDVLVKSASS